MDNPTPTTATNGNNNPFLQVVVNPDGSLSRPPLPLAPPSSSSSVSSKDVTLNSDHGTRLRLYLPKYVDHHNRLPIILFFHGGGFIIFSYDFVLYHSLCENMAAHLPAVIVSVGYRLAPESRLPAAYDDAVDAMHWLRSAASSNILGGADFSRCFLMGCSAGANIVYHAALRYTAEEAENLLPLRIPGVIMNQPFFGGVERTESEVERVDDDFLPLRATDMMWSLALPQGTDRDHEYCNPMQATATMGGEETKCKLPRCLVTGSINDPLMDRQRKFVAKLEASGVSVMARLDRAGPHASEIIDPNMATLLFDDVKCFIDDSARAEFITPADGE